MGASGVHSRPMKVYMVLLLSLVTVAGTFAADLVLEDFDGKVEQKSGSSWKGLDIGSKVVDSATIRVSGQGLAEFRSGNLRIHVAKDGTYQLAALVEKAKNAPSASLLQIVADKTERLLGNKRASGEEANAGVRADEVGANSLAWAEDDESADAGADSLHQAQTLATQGRDASALRKALSAAIAPTSSLYAASVLLIAQEALIVGDDDLVVSRAAEARPYLAADNAQVLNYLEALARKSLGQADASVALLKQVVAAGADTPVGQKAASLLPH